MAILTSDQYTHMANTYSQVYIHTVFAVKYRQSLIQSAWKKDLMAVIGNLINQSGCQTIIVNGVHDHVHCLFVLKPRYSISEIMKSVKAKSSKWINEKGLSSSRFEWQKGFGCFSYGKSQVPSVYQYIQNQEKHHEKKRFREEYIELLERFEIDYSEDFIFNEPV